MRTLLTTKNSTHAERRFAEHLKRMHIPFKHRVKIDNIEIDFVIGKYAVEIDGHQQDPERNKKLVELGYTPLHFQNKGVDLVKLWQTQQSQEQTSSHQ